MAQNSSTSQTNKHIEFQKLYPDARMPERAHDQDAGLDLFAYASEEQRKYLVGPGDTILVSTGLKINMPTGYKGLVVPRSGRSIQRPFIQPNSPGTIDPGFQGELMVPQRNVGPGAMEITDGEKLAQLLVLPVEYFEPKEVKAFTNRTQRGEKGYGSTGND